jgi:hypothetical protein
MMKSSSQILIVAGALLAVASTPLVQADTGSDWFDAEVTAVQHRIASRNQLDDDLVLSQVALGYAVPESLHPQSKTMLARSDDNAFDTVLKYLQGTMEMYAAVD